ncbi:MAG: sugar transferase [Lachnospiraceae bacterium]|nr:sugar transferase [Lachnospiraceae bacterium]
MNSKIRVTISYLILALDLLTIACSFALSTWIRYRNFRDMDDKISHFGTMAMLLVMCMLYTMVFDQNRDFLRRGAVREAYELIRLDAAVTAAALVLLYMIKTAGAFSRLVMGYYVVISYFAMLFVHVGVRAAIRRYFVRTDAATKVLVITERAGADDCIERLRRTLDISYRIVAAVFTDEDGTGEKISGVPVIASREKAAGIATTMQLDEVFIDTPHSSQSQLEDLITGFSDMGVAVHFCLEPGGVRFADSRVGMFGNYSVISYTRGTGRNRGLLIKRITDILGGAVGLVITALITPFIAVAIKLDSRGPVFFSQVRIGRNGRRFKIYKFRTMVRDAEEKKKELEKDNEMKGLMFKMKDDPRVTKVGAFLRKTSLDEFPQFLNVLRGEMSLVGTRPPTEEEFEKYNAIYRRRISMTPGLTGMWQVSGRSGIEDFDEVVKYDLEYIDHWSLQLDMQILFKTIGVVFTGRGAE